MSHTNNDARLLVVPIRDDILQEEVSARAETEDPFVSEVQKIRNQVRGLVENAEEHDHSLLLGILSLCKVIICNNVKETDIDD